MAWRTHPNIVQQFHQYTKRVLMPHKPIETGVVPTPHGGLAYRRINKGAGTPLLVVHGGPGAGSRYMRRLEELAPQRDTVFYDQLGCGDSPATDNADLWTIGRFAAEIGHVRRHLGLAEVHLYGHSSGGWVCLEYLSGGPRGVRSVALANTTPSIAEFEAGVAQRVSELDPADRAVVAEFEPNPWSSDERYLGALSAFYARHIVSTTAHARKLLELQRSSQAYRTMIGPHELAVVGNLAGWDRRRDLYSIDAPVLVIVGGRDHVVPESARALCASLPNAEMVEFPACGHDPLNEAPAETLSKVSDFLNRQR